MSFELSDREELRDYNARLTERGMVKLTLVEANILKALWYFRGEVDERGATIDDVVELTGYTKGQVIHALEFLDNVGYTLQP